ncbi:aldo/keto reductase [Nocardia sp. XZ_19_385]|uniref:aldo/keto reductase n=1 Tax=Nocardia sp. XZ_19_385 TaxID=2769488 RepID=UPI002106D5E4|nr:aldo/keto reductase [Nocardia sp. XZ_19_385]
MTAATLGGALTLGEDLTITRMGYGAMQFGLPGVVGPPADPSAAIAVLRQVVELGIRHIDTSDFYGAGGVNELIHTALHPYPDGLRIATKVGYRSDSAGDWTPSHDPADLVRQVHENLEHLGLDVLDLVNLRASKDNETVSDAVFSEQFSDRSHR